MIEQTNSTTRPPVTFASLEALQAHLSTFNEEICLCASGTVYEVWINRVGTDGIKRPRVLATYRLC